MKKLILAALILITSFKSFSQGNFAPVGAKWHYQYFDLLFFAWYPVVVETTDTATIGGKLCNKLEITSGATCTLKNPFYIYESNDSVYHYLQNTNSFGLLYNFNAQLGDTITLTVDDIMTGTSNIYLVIDSIGTAIINGLNKNIYHWSQINFPWNYDFSGSAIEDIGNITFLFPQYGPCDPYAYGLRCYQDSIVGLYQTGIATSCNVVTDVNELSSSNLTSISPNPFSTSININSENLKEDDYTISVYDLPGKIIYQTKKQFSNKTSVELSDLTKGIYFLKITGNHFAATKKILKQ